MGLGAGRGEMAWANLDCSGEGLEEPGRDKGSGSVTHHLHVFPREVLDLLFHPLDTLQQVLILLVHPLVLLHQGLQLDLRLAGAFQLQSDRHRGQQP